MIALGCIAKDKITGFSGVVTQKVEQLNGNTQFALQPKMGEGDKTMPEAILIDFHTLETVEAHLECIPAPVATIALGSKVRDMVTDMTGIAVERITYLNGCIRYAVTQKKNDKSLLDGAPPAFFTYQQQLEVIGSGLSKTAVEPSPKATGGPMTRISAQSARR